MAVDAAPEDRATARASTTTPTRRRVPPPTSPYAARYGLTPPVGASQTPSPRGAPAPRPDYRRPEDYASIGWNVVRPAPAARLHPASTAPYARSTRSIPSARPSVLSPAVGRLPAAGVASRTRRGARGERGRHVHVTLGIVALLLVGFGARTLLARPAGARQGARPVEAAQAVDGNAKAQSGPVGPAGVVAVPTPAPPIVFSFAKFESNPALVAGAASEGAPALSGDSAIVVDVTSKDVLYAKQPNKRQLMASTAKIMTGIVAVEHSPLDKIYAVPQEATEAEPNHMGVRTGEQLTLQELLYGMFLDSGNDAAETVAYGVGGGGAVGRAQFITWMNEKVAQLGLKDTRFVNPSGLDDPQQYSSAYDLAVMGAYAIGKPELRQTFATKEIVIVASKEPGHQHGWFNPGNLNSLLATYRGAFGIKPGYTEDAGYTLVAAAERDGRTLVAVTLNSRRHFSDATALLDFGFKR